MPKGKQKKYNNGYQEGYTRISGTFSMEEGIPIEFKPDYEKSKQFLDYCSKNMILTYRNKPLK